MKAAPSAIGVLIVEDDEELAASVSMVLGGEGYSVTHNPDGAEGCEQALNEEFDLVITDFRLPGMGGLDLLHNVVENKPQLPVIVMTGHGTAETAIAATKEGAFDFLVKPFELEELLSAVEKAADCARLNKRRIAIPETAKPRQGTKARTTRTLIGTSRAMQEICKQIGMVAATPATVLIRGESGSGKEVVARAVFHHSDRSNNRFIAVNCAAIPENLLESELFGHEKGAFTGAETRRIGRFEQADKGTLFLDEIGDLPVATQSKLLRVLQERTIQRVGSGEDIQVDVRIIAATHKPIDDMLEDGSFREDLYFRLNTVVLHLPPLRERLSDIPEFVNFFVHQISTDYQIPTLSLSDKSIRFLQKQNWPGNIRQLENVITKAILVARGRPITPDVLGELVKSSDLPSRRPDSDSEVDIVGWMESLVTKARENGGGNAYQRAITVVERALFEEAWRQSGARIGKCSDWLGVSRVTLRQKFDRYGIKPAKKKKH